LLQQEFTQLAKILGGLFAQIADFGVQIPRRVSQIAPQFIGGIATLAVFGRSPAIQRVDFAFNEPFQRVQALLRVATDLIGFTRKIVFETLKTPIVFSHQRAKKNVPNSVYLSGFIDPAIRAVGILVLHWVLVLVGHGVVIESSIFHKLAARVFGEEN
jgi:hypothetical protein